MGILVQQKPGYKSCNQKLQKAVSRMDLKHTFAYVQTSLKIFENDTCVKNFSHIICTYPEWKILLGLFFPHFIAEFFHFFTG